MKETGDIDFWGWLGISNSGENRVYFRFGSEVGVHYVTDQLLALADDEKFDFVAAEKELKLVRNEIEIPRNSLSFYDHTAQISMGTQDGDCVTRDENSVCMVRLDNLSIENLLYSNSCPGNSCTTVEYLNFTALNGNKGIVEVTVYRKGSLK